MVDLVKLRKKAKKQGAEHSAQGTVHSAQSTDAPPPTPSSPLPTPDSQLPTPSTDKLSRFMQEAGKLRESVEEGAQAEQAPDTTQLELLTFTIAGEQYAVDIEQIVEIVRPRPITRVPNAEGSIVGIVSLRGTIVTLIDVRKRLRQSKTDETPDTRIIVVDHHGETIGFEVDRVLRVVKIGRKDVEPNPVVHSSEADDSIRGVFRQTGALTILLDFDKLLALPHGTHL
ncbi:MAG TPA: chemotaxis protein CheW [Thermoanaerobaculia bacterium]|jgi:purine-binding chemotaxis protein CheW|nr:chemotaxis protein CheW [Thermoanaerobaculia bacterium]